MKVQSAISTRGGWGEIVSVCERTGCVLVYFLKQTSLASRKLKIIASTHFSDEPADIIQEARARNHGTNATTSCRILTGRNKIFLFFVASRKQL